MPLGGETFVESSGSLRCRHLRQTCRPEKPFGSRHSSSSPLRWEGRIRQDLEKGILRGDEVIAVKRVTDARNTRLLPTLYDPKRRRQRKLLVESLPKDFIHLRDVAQQVNVRHADLQSSSHL